MAAIVFFLLSPAQQRQKDGLSEGAAALNTRTPRRLPFALPLALPFALPRGAQRFTEYGVVPAATVHTRSSANPTQTRHPGLLPRDRRDAPLPPPISSRRTLLFCQRLNIATTERLTLMDRVQARAARLWTDWEKKDGGWQKKVVEYGNYAFRRIPYEEWGLKSVAAPVGEAEGGGDDGDQHGRGGLPQDLMPMDKVPGILEALATEREALHRRKLIWCFVGMPITAPVALIPL